MDGSTSTADLNSLWRWSRSLHQSVKVIDSTIVWGNETVTVFVPSTGRTTSLPAADLSGIDARLWRGEEVAARASVLHALQALSLPQVTVSEDADIELLPHQAIVVERALSMSPTRLLLADEVGLGKTIEAGMIIRELKARGTISKILVVVPKSLQLQWVAEMRRHFAEDFVRLGPGGVPFDAGTDIWSAFDQVVCSMDSIKPVKERKGWDTDRLRDHNRSRFEAVVSAGWDLVIIDEAHHAAGSQSDVARHQLAKTLSENTSHLLLLSATPHSGKTDAFGRLMSLLDQDFAIGKPITRASVQPLVVRTEKRTAIDSKGHPLFTPRTTTSESVQYGARDIESELYDAVTEYVRHGYARAIAEKNYAVGFLTLLLQRLVSSSTAAIRSALERRLFALTDLGDQLQLFPMGAEEWGDLSGEEQIEAFTTARQGAWGNEYREVELLLDLTRKAAATGPDAKTSHLLDLLQRVRRKLGEPSLKFVVFTEFVQTQRMLVEFLGDAGFDTATINGSMSISAREIAQKTFQEHADILVSTDAGGEGINLQFANVVINYDMPWNPMRVEQRIGRVDRIGQTRRVLAFNLVLDHSIDDRVLEVLESKLNTIVADMGIDKRSDILESSARSVEDLYATALLDPDKLDTEASRLLNEAKVEVEQGQSLEQMMQSDSPVTPQRSGSGAIIAVALAKWRDWKGDAPAEINDVISELPITVPGEPVPVLSGSTSGYLTVWELTAGRYRSIYSVFRSDSGQIRPDLAQEIWDLAETTQPVDYRVPSPEVWSELTQLGSSYAPAPGDEATRNAAPVLNLRLVIRSDR